MSDKLDQMEKMWKNILDTLICRICMNYVSAPVRQCSEGHLVCCECIKKVGVCPQCRSSFIKTRNRAIEDITEVILYPCVNASLGCTEKFSNKEKENHGKDCRLRHLLCPFSKCTWSGSRAQLSAHLTKKHPGTLLNNSADYGFSYKIGLESVQMKFLYAYNEIFKIIVHQIKGHIYGYVMMYGSSKNAARFKYELRFEKRPGYDAAFGGTTIAEVPIDNVRKNEYIDVKTSALYKYTDCDQYVVLRVLIYDERDEASNIKESKEKEKARDMSYVDDLEKLFNTAANGQVRALRGGEDSEGLMIGSEPMEDYLDQLVRSVEDVFEDLTKYGLGRPMWWYLSVFGVAEELWKAKAKEKRKFAEYLALELFQESDVTALVFTGAMDLVSAVAEWAAVDMAVKFISNEMKALGIPHGSLDGAVRNACYRKGVLKLMSRSQQLGGRQAVKKAISRLNQGTRDTQRPSDELLQDIKEGAVGLNYSVLIEKCKRS